MKGILIYLNTCVLLVLLTQSGFTQDVTAVTLKFNEKKFETDNLKKLMDLKEGDYYQIKITGINLNLYKISINGSDSIIAQKLETPNFGLFNLDALGKAVAGIGEVATSATVAGERFGMIIKAYDAQPESKGEDPWSLRVNAEQTLHHAYKDNLLSIGDRIDKLKFEINKFRMDAVAIGTGTFDYKSKMKEAEDIRIKLADVRKKALKQKDEFHTFSKANPPPTDDFEKQDKAIKEAYDKLLGANAEIAAAISAEKTLEFLRPAIFLGLNNGKEYLSVPIQFRGETGSVSIKIEPRKDEYLLQSYNTKLRFPERKQSYLSVGASFYGSGLHDEGYSTLGTPTSDTTLNYKLIKESPGDWEFGLVTLMRWGVKFNDERNIGGHFSFGPAISIGKTVKPRLAIGAGFAFGKRHMFAVDFGIIAGHVNVLSNAYDTSLTYTVEPENPVVSQLKSSGFISLGYLFTL